MATTQQNTTEYGNIVSVPPKTNVRPGSKFYQPFTHTQVGAGDANSTVTVWRIQPGMRLHLKQSWMRWTAFGTARVLQFGWEAYTDDAGTIVAADPDGLFAALDVAAIGMADLIAAPTLGVGLDVYRSRLFRGPANLVLTCTGGTWPDGAVISGELCVSPGGS